MGSCICGGARYCSIQACGNAPSQNRPRDACFQCGGDRKRWCALLLPCTGVWMRVLQMHSGCGIDWRGHRHCWLMRFMFSSLVWVALLLLFLRLAFLFFLWFEAVLCSLVSCLVHFREKTLQYYWLCCMVLHDTTFSCGFVSVGLAESSDVLVCIKCV